MFFIPSIFVKYCYLLMGMYFRKCLTYQCVGLRNHVLLYCSETLLSEDREYDKSLIVLLISLELQTESLTEFGDKCPYKQFMILHSTL